MSQPFRLAAGGRIDRSRPLLFTFDGTRYQGFAGDTLASALLANGVRVTGRSFKYHRPRGVMAAGCDEPNTIVQLGEGRWTEPNLKATQVELYEGLDARAVNCAPSARWDWMALTQWLKPLMPAGFYYKTFMAPHWHWYEGAIRRAAGLGKSPIERDPEFYDKQHAECDVLVVGAGESGRAAAIEACQSGKRVMLVDDQPEVRGLVGGTSVPTDSGLTPLPQILPRTTAFGYFDHNHVLAVQLLTDHQPHDERRGPRQRLWKIRAGEVILATGAIERPLVFANNDRPGVMLAGAARQYLERFGVIPGRRVVIATNNDSAYAVAEALRDAGVEIVATADLRKGSAPTNVYGAHGVRAVELHRIDDAGRALQGTRQVLEADALLVSGGWNPTAHLFSQSGGKMRFDDQRQAFVPETSVQRERSVGAAAGQFDHGNITAIWEIDGSAIGRDGRKSWVDFLSDVTAEDLRLAVRESFRSVEHVKRYTTTGMAPDQGKTSNVNAIGIIGAALGKLPGEVGTTKFRPPFNPVTLGTIAGRRRGASYRPLRHLPAHDRHVELGAHLEDYGGWLRPAFYPRAGESEAQAIAREVLAVRNQVGLFEASPLGKILVTGDDAGELLHRLYVNNIRSLKVGRCRYGMMLGEDGVVMDDGICTRLADDRYLVGTTSGNAGRITDWLEEWLQCEWVALEALVENVTTQWAVMTLTGPRAREVLASLRLPLDLSPEAMPHMSAQELRVGELPMRIMRVSFTGELSYEISVPRTRGKALWDALAQAGAAAHGLQPFGVEAMMALRIEKGYLHVGSETDGTTFPQDVGFGGIVAQKADDFAGRRSTLTPEGRRADRRQFVGLRATDDRTPLPVGAHVVGSDFGQAPYLSQGWVTSSIVSPTLGRPVALAMIENGRARLGESVLVYDAGRAIAAHIVQPAAWDPEGKRLNG